MHNKNIMGTASTDRIIRAGITPEVGSVSAVGLGACIFINTGVFAEDSVVLLAPIVDRCAVFTLTV